MIRSTFKSEESSAESHHSFITRYYQYPKKFYTNDKGKILKSKIVASFFFAVPIYFSMIGFVKYTQEVSIKFSEKGDKFEHTDMINCEEAQEGKCTIAGIMLLKFMICVQLLICSYCIIHKLKNCAERLCFPPYARKYLIKLMHDAFLFICILIFIFHLRSLSNGTFLEINDENSLMKPHEIAYLAFSYLFRPLRCFVAVKLIHALLFKVREGALNVGSSISFILSLHTSLTDNFWSDNSSFEIKSKAFLLLGIMLMVINLSNKILDYYLVYSEKALVRIETIYKHNFILYLQALISLLLVSVILMGSFKHKESIHFLIEEWGILIYLTCFSISYTLGFLWLNCLLYYTLYEYELTVNQPKINAKYSQYYYKLPDRKKSSSYFELDNSTHGP